MKQKPKRSQQAAKPAAMTDRQKIDVLRVLTALLDSVGRAASAARREGWQEEAELLDHWFATLNQQIDALRACVLRAWVADAQSLVETAGARQRDIEAAINDLKRSKQTAETAIKIAGHVDEAIKMAVKLLG